MDGAEFPQDGGRPKTKIVFIVLAAAFLLGAGFFFGKFGVGSIGGFLGQSAALISDTFRDVLGFNSRGRIATEIDLNGSPAAGYQEAGSAPASAPFARSESSRLLKNKNAAAEEKIENNSTGSNKNQTASGKPAAAAAVTSTSVKISTVAPPSAGCNFSSGGSTSPAGANPTRAVLLNEIAWMGSPPENGETSAQASNNEWLELKNISALSADLSGWQILSQSEKLKIVFAASEKIAAGKFYLLERTDDETVSGIKADKIYSGTLSNSGDWLRLFNRSCVLVDEINASAGWPGGDNATKQTLERNIADFGWHTSVSPGGTPRAENSAPAVQPSSPQAPVTQSSSPQATSTQSQTVANPDLRSFVAVSIQGDGLGMVTSTPVGINCGFDCSEEYQSGTTVVLSATPALNSTFDGWSGACGSSTLLTAGSSTPLTTGGSRTCNLTVATTVISVTAAFKLTAPLVVSAVEPPPPAFWFEPPLVITEVMAGSDVSADYEFIELYNPTGAVIDLTGWTVKKRNSNGVESTLVVASRLADKNIPPGRHFLLARDGGYSGIVVPDVLWPTSSSYLLAYTGNAVMLYDALGNKVDEVAWTEIPKNTSYERLPLDGNLFIAQPNPNPQNSQMP